MNDEQRRRIEQWKRDVEEQNAKEDAEAEAAGIQRTRRGHLVRCAADYRARVVAEVARVVGIERTAELETLAAHMYAGGLMMGEELRTDPLWSNDDELAERFVTASTPEEFIRRVIYDRVGADE